jgi:four helix bundle protein
MGHELANELHRIIKTLPQDGSNLPGTMRVTSVRIPYAIAGSISKKQPHEKLTHYVEAREAASDLQKHLMLAKNIEYIEEQVFEALASKAIQIEHILSALIRKARYDMAAAE